MTALHTCEILVAKTFMQKDNDDIKCMPMYSRHPWTHRHGNESSPTIRSILMKKDPVKRQFESNFLRTFSALTQLPQQEALRIARANVEYALAMYSDGYSADETARYMAKLVKE